MPNPSAQHFEMESLTKRQRTGQPLLPVPLQMLATERCRCSRIIRRNWTTTTLLSHPIGVYEQVTSHGQTRFHAVFSSPSGDSILGCFQTIHAAAAAWDAEARRHRWELLNMPVGVSEQCILSVLRTALLPTGKDVQFPFPPTDTVWRSKQFAIFMLHVRDAGPEQAWVSARDLQQSDHALAPGTQLCFSYMPHIFGTCKALTCTPGWQLRNPKASSVSFFSKAENRARCMRAVVEMSGNTSFSLEALRRQVCIFSGSWVLNFQALVAAALYRRYAGPGSVVYDPCAGWGGRLLGAIAAKVKTYLACEPSSRTHAGLEQIASDFATPAGVQVPRPTIPRPTHTPTLRLHH